MDRASVFIGLGSNLDEPVVHVRQALQELSALPHTRLAATSSLYRSKAIGPGDQPDYINAVAQLETLLEPVDLLDQLQDIEQRHGRVRAERWGARTLDLDILLYGNSEISLPRLTVPHPWLKQRNFVLLPLADVAPNLILPDGSALLTLLDDVGRADIQRVDENPAV